jgi:putative alpha-1,2-mannosidase
MMRTRRLAALAVLLLCLCLPRSGRLGKAEGPGEDEASAVDLVNVMIGTAAEGQTFPATGVPFAMTQWTPQTRAGEGKCVAPYYAADTKIQGFRGIS